MMVQDLDAVVDLTETEGIADVVQAMLQVGNQKYSYSLQVGYWSFDFLKRLDLETELLEIQLILSINI